MRYAFLGRVEYERALSLQHALRGAVAEGRVPDTLLLLEHPPVLTLGRSADRRHVLVSDEELERQQITVAQVGRGGDVTYHGPGQIVGYPIRRVGRRIRAHVDGMRASIIELLAEQAVAAWWEPDNPGVWTSRGKIAAIGVDARGGVAMHGFALNVDVCLEHFALIVPCGLARPVASLAQLVSPVPTVAQVADALAPLLARAYETALEPVDAEALWSVTQ